MTSIVLLYRQIPYLDQHVLEDSASKAWQIEFDPGEASMTFVAGASPIFLLKADGRVYSIHHVNEPYFDCPTKSERELIECRTLHVLENHSGYISIELLEDESTQYNSDQEMARIGQLVSHWVNDDLLAVAFPQSEQILPWDASLESKLAKPVYGSNLRCDSPVLNVSDDNPEMKAAVERARNQWPQFEAAFEANAQREQQGEAPENFSVKAPITVDGETEFIWLTVTAIENKIIYGLLSNKPIALAGLELGDRVRVPIAQLNDWLYSFRGQRIGGFTVKILKDLMQR